MSISTPLNEFPVSTISSVLCYSFSQEISCLTNVIFLAIMKQLFMLHIYIFWFLQINSTRHRPKSCSHRNSNPCLFGSKPNFKQPSSWFTDTCHGILLQKFFSHIVSKSAPSTTGLLILLSLFCTKVSLLYFYSLCLSGKLPDGCGQLDGIEMKPEMVDRIQTTDILCQYYDETRDTQ